MNRKFKRAALHEIFCHIINVFTLTIDQFNSSFKKKKKNSTDPNIWTAVYAESQCCMTYSCECDIAFIQQLIQYHARG